MKNITVALIILMIFLSTNTTAQDRWFWQNPLPQGNGLSDVFIIDQKKVVAVGDVGTVVRTTDGGTNWSTQHYVTGTQSFLSDLYFLDENTGWAAGTEGIILKTTDGGISWYKQNSGTSEAIRDIFFIRENGQDIGWAVSFLGLVLKTTDGGNRWQVIHDLYAYPRSIYFVDSKIGWLGADRGNIYKTIDGGSNWQRQYTGSDNYWLSSIHFVNQDTGWAACWYEGIILKTTDGGNTWQAQHNSFYDDYYSILFINPSIGWAVGSNNAILKTTDGGVTWNTQKIDVGESDLRLSSVRFLNEDIGWIVGEYGIILKTINGGTTWHIQTERALGYSYHDIFWENLNSIYFIDTTTGWTVGKYGCIMKSDNGGNNWQQKTSGTDCDLTSVCFSNKNNGWAVGGEYCTILIITKDGGDTWQSLSTGISEPLLFVHNLNDTIAFAVGNAGVILRSSINNNSCQKINSGTTVTLNSIFLLNQYTGWAVGWSGTILKTTDGGATWQDLSSGTTNILHSVYFIDEYNGWVTGVGGTLLQTNNGGESWQIKSCATPYNLPPHWLSVYFSDNNTGWLLGERRDNDLDNPSGSQSPIMKTIDGGNNWELEQCPASRLKSFYFLDGSNAWAVGGASAIIRMRAEEVTSVTAKNNVKYSIQNFILFQNYPNPFNSETIIRFHLSRSSFVVLKIYNLLGYEIETLVNNHLKSGEYEFQWNAGSLPSGIYFCHLEAEGFSESKKLFLLR